MLLQNRTSLKNVAVIFLAVVSILGGMLIAQVRRKQQGPRALGVLEILPSGRARLIPITILVDGKWYDAGLYKADPLPMALEPGTVYEGEKTGSSQGLFSISSAQQLGRQWFGLGTWKSNTPEPSTEKPTAKPAKSVQEEEDQPPVLRRGEEKPAQPAHPEITTPPAGNASEAKAQQREQPSQTASKQESRPASQDDTGRPILRRGKPKQEQAEELGWPSGSAKADAKPGEPVLSQTVQTLAAISDASGPEPRPYTMLLKPDERRNYEQKMGQFAADAIKRFATTHRVGQKAVPSVTLSDIRMPVFDVNTNNEPILVYEARGVESEPARPQSRATGVPAKQSAARKPATPVEAKPQPQVPAPGTGASLFQYYVTIVARVDVNGEVHKLFDQVTDTGHLDAYPRLTLIDCVDANGDGAGELLFRETYDRSRGYALYRVGIDRLWELFEGASSPFVAAQ